MEDLPRALLLGGPGWHPFNGHLRLALGAREVGLHLAGSVAQGADPATAYAAAQALGAGLRGASGRDRFGLLRSAWERLAALDPASLGPAAGRDLALLLVAFDQGGTAIAGTGLAALYALDAAGAVELVPAAHPLLATEGIPEQPPGLLAPERGPGTVVGAARAGALDPAGCPSWTLACGVHPEDRP